MRGLIKRDDPKLQASVHTPDAAGQLPDGACLRSFAVAVGELPLRMHLRNEPKPRRLLPYGASAYVEAYIRWRHAALPPCSVAAARILGRPCLHCAFSSCFPRPQLGLLALGQYRRVVSTRQARGRMER